MKSYQTILQKACVISVGPPFMTTHIPKKRAQATTKVLTAMLKFVSRARVLPDCVNVSGSGLYRRLHEKEQLADHWLVMWTRGKVIRMTLQIDCMASFTPARLDLTAWIQQ